MAGVVAHCTGGTQRDVGSLASSSSSHCPPCFSSRSVIRRVLRGHRDSVVGLDLFSFPHDSGHDAPSCCDPLPSPSGNVAGGAEELEETCRRNGAVLLHPQSKTHLPPPRHPFSGTPAASSSAPWLGGHSPSTPQRTGTPKTRRLSSASQNTSDDGGSDSFQDLSSSSSCSSNKKGDDGRVSRSASTTHCSCCPARQSRENGQSGASLAQEESSRRCPAEEWKDPFGHAGRPLFSTPSPLLASSSDDGTVRLWDLRVEKSVACLSYPLFFSSGSRGGRTSELRNGDHTPQSNSVDRGVHGPPAASRRSCLGALRFHPQTWQFLYVACGSALLGFDLRCCGDEEGERGGTSGVALGPAGQLVSDRSGSLSTSCSSLSTERKRQKEFATTRRDGDVETPPSFWDSLEISSTPCVWSMETYAQTVPSSGSSSLGRTSTGSEDKRPEEAEEVQQEEDEEGAADETDDDDDDPLTINDFDVWCPSPERVLGMHFEETPVQDSASAHCSAAGGTQTSSSGTGSKRRGQRKATQQQGRHSTKTSRRKKGPAGVLSPSPNDTSSSFLAERQRRSSMCGLAPVCLALPLDTGEVVVALHRPKKEGGGDEIEEGAVAAVGEEGKNQSGRQPLQKLEQQKKAGRRLWAHKSICGVARFRPEGGPQHFPDLITGGFDFNVNSYNLMEAKPRASIEVRKAIPDLRSHVMPWEKPSSLSSRHVSGTKAPLGSNSFSVYGGDRESDLPRNQCLNPPFVISAAMHPEGSRLAVGLGDGCLAVFDYASSNRNARLLPAPSWISRPHTSSSAALSWVRTRACSCLYGHAPGCKYSFSGASTRVSNNTRFSPALLFSCGNDRMLCLFREGTGGEGSSDPTAKYGSSLELLMKYRLPHKPNCLVASSACSSSWGSAFSCLPAECKRDISQDAPAGRLSVCPDPNCCQRALAHAGFSRSDRRVAEKRTPTSDILRCYIGDVSRDITVLEFP